MIKSGVNGEQHMNARLVSGELHVLSGLPDRVDDKTDCPARLLVWLIPRQQHRGGVVGNVQPFALVNQLYKIPNYNNFTLIKNNF